MLVYSCIWKKDCIYKYIYHSSLFVSLPFDIISVHLAWALTFLFDRLWEDPFYFSIKEHTLMKNDNRSHTHTAGRYDCLSHTVLNKEWDVVWWWWGEGGYTGATGTLLFVNRWASNTRGLIQGLLEPGGVPVCGVLYNRGEPCTEKVNKAFNQSADVWKQGTVEKKQDVNGGSLQFA